MLCVTAWPHSDPRRLFVNPQDSGPNVMVEPQPDVLTELTHTDLHGLGIDEEEEILRQLADPAFEIDAIFADLDPRLEPHGAQAVAVGMVPGDDQAQSACRKRRRRRSEEPPPGCSGLQPFHQVGASSAKEDPGTLFVVAVLSFTLRLVYTFAFECARLHCNLL